MNLFVIMFCVSGARKHDLVVSFVMCILYYTPPADSVEDDNILMDSFDSQQDWKRKAEELRKRAGRLYLHACIIFFALIPFFLGDTSFCLVPFAFGRAGAGLGGAGGTVGAEART